ncbi:hypothetical protein Lepto7375DRAFT_3970 [Leptolyngbya sp. PCC 7375]|nr:hypothetical protein Lepto7375DRAFT_1054 [Leptolyngbya sp. PCC 7375]EKV01780.1 hypothetical protein Lepto7375DRAFT_3970 [Leptolyngbya sp. PCC 7375]
MSERNESPVCLSSEEGAVATVAATEAAETDQCLEPTAGESSECPVRTGGDE